MQHARNNRNCCKSRKQICQLRRLKVLWLQSMDGAYLHVSRALFFSARRRGNLETADYSQTPLDRLQRKILPVAGSCSRTLRSVGQYCRSMESCLITGRISLFPLFPLVSSTSSLIMRARRRHTVTIRLVPTGLHTGQSDFFPCLSSPHRLVLTR